MFRQIDTLLPLNITLRRDDNPVFSFNLTKNDTTIIDTNLSPGGSYNYNIAAVINGEGWTGDKLQVQTLATTSHNFTWQKYESGTGASSILRDVAIIDENNIWAVGEIYADTTGLRFNAAQWDGNSWTIKRVPYYYQGQPFYNPIQTIFAFGPNDIWFGGNGIIHWDGNQYNPIPIPTIVWGPHQINKIWGTSDNNLYIVGNDGKIAHYQNGSWSKIESGTDLNIVDIWGDINPFTNKTEIVCGAANIFVNPSSELIRIKEDLTTEILDKTGLGQTFAPLWFKSGIRYYVVGDGLYEKTYKDSSIWLNLNNNITQYFMECIRGSALNNIIVAGAFGEVIHFNGISWASIKNAETTLNNGSYYRVAVKGNISVAVGYDDGKGVILLGHHL